MPTRPRSGCVTCCSYPNGWTPILPSIFSFLATILSTITWATCHFAHVQTDQTGRSSTWSHDLGLFSRERLVTEYTPTYTYDGYYETYYSSSTCIEYSYFDVLEYHDLKFKSAQGFGLIAGLCGLIMMIVTWVLSPCVAVSKLGWRIVGGIFLGIGLLQLLTLLVLSSSYCTRCGLGAYSSCTSSCSLVSGGHMSIVAGILWFVSGASCFSVPDILEGRGAVGSAWVPTSRGTIRLVREPNASHSRHGSEATATVEAVQIEMPEASLATALGTAVATEATTQRILEDGTTVYETVTTKADGTTAVTTTRIPPDRRFDKM